MCDHMTQWANHDQSLRLEEETKKKILDRIDEKVASASGTWIDWQYLTDSVGLLRKVCGLLSEATSIICYYLLLLLLCSVGILSSTPIPMPTTWRDQRRNW